MLPLLLALACAPASVGLLSTTADYAGPGLTLGEALVLDLGTASEGERLEATIPVGNEGDLPLGIGTVHLSSSGVHSDRGHAGAFDWRWADDDDPGAGLDGVEALSRVIPPWDTATLVVGFEPVREGVNADAILLYTSTGGDDPDPERRAHDDWTQPRGLVWLEGRGETTLTGVPLMPGSVDFGFSWPEHEPATEWIDLENVGSGPMVVEEVRLRDCAPGFAITDAPKPGSEVASGDRTAIGVAYAAPHEGRVYCLLEALVDGEAASTSMQANTRSGCPDSPPVVELIEPASATAVEAGDTLRLWLAAADADQPPDTLWCQVRSAILLGHGLGVCEAGDGPVSMDVATADYRSPGVDVIHVVVEDACGQRAEASVPLLVDTSWPEDDEDGDAFGAEDCDDADPTVYPWAAERPNGVDDDCDFFTDEGTSRRDDDGDGLSEEEGDCDDSDADVWPGAFEQPNGKDDDCDGDIDEGTVLADDDGDGTSEAYGDCNDDDAQIHPRAREICRNGTDDDCDQQVDEEPCIDLSTRPMLVGGIWLDQGQVEVGGQVEAAIRALDEEGDDLTVLWEVSGGTVEPLPPMRMRWTAPHEPGPHRLSARIIDPTDQDAWDFQSILVVREGGLVRGQEPVPPACGHVSAVSIAWVVALVAMGTRRRRD